MLNQKGNMSVWVILGAVVIVILGVIYFTAKPSDKMESGTMTNETKITEDKTIVKDESSADLMYKGNKLAGNKSPFLEFNQEDYQKALSENKIIILDFYANWCPICRGEAPDLHEGFNQLDNPDVIGFRVNFNDDETDENERNLAKEFDITYQHTKVILKDGKQVLKSGDIWDTEKFLTEVQKAL